MPLLCISLLALLLLPLSLSCDTQASPKEVSDKFMSIVQTLLTNARENITTLLQNSTCRERRNKTHSCVSSENQDVVSTLHILNCDMTHIGLSQTAQLTRNVWASIHCNCRKKKAKEEQRRNEQKKSRRLRRLCRAKAILLNMTQCYQMLNTIVST